MKVHMKYKWKLWNALKMVHTCHCCLRLAVHLIYACGIYVSQLIFAMEISNKIATMKTIEKNSLLLTTRKYLMLRTTIDDNNFIKYNFPKTKTK